MSLLRVEALRIAYPGNERPVVDALTFALERGESVGLIGESGSGKSQTALALMGLLPGNARVRGSVRFAGEELLGASDRCLNRIRPCRMAMVFQDPRAALNPYLTIGRQLEYIVRAHRLATRREAPARVLDMLRRVGLPDAERQLSAYPHQLSGGMRQRAMIAAALLGEPELLVADEPTTALDVTVQAQILALLRSLRRELNATLLLITHDLGVVAGNCERLLVLERGRLVEGGGVRETFAHPQHACTRTMLAAAPALADIPLAGAPTPAANGVLLEATRLDVRYRVQPYRAVWRREEICAVRQVSLQLRRGETLALVGESGSGKTSVARALLGLLPMAGGQLRLQGDTLPATVEQRSIDARRALQLVFQDPAGSLNPAMRIADIVAEPLLALRTAGDARSRRAAVEQMLSRVGLPANLALRRPHELSGGQAQRVAIARALIVAPAVLICDEAVAALDGTVRREILALIREQQLESGLAVLFISHDLSAVKSLSHRVMVMYMGRVCEVTQSSALFARPRHPYTRALLDAVPAPDPTVAPRLDELRGEVSSLYRPPGGCVFHPRCRHAVERCRHEVPELTNLDGRQVACHRAAELDLSRA